ncbi:aldose epimerase family protein [Sphingomonas canadensis]|uniref:Aldose 1-epimerase n=1 Tax=Sphingomonas canadensis TaxID=1219257 RepID=A0ABW3HAD9_9SPHN|nr:aldose epimerase family protein [Sphingomonas canadensis]MCW3838227.1 galactose mutarotase [Sphingomonas canadensis]
MTGSIEIAHGPFRAELMTLGATLRRLEVPGRDGRAGNVVLGYRDPASYLGPPAYLGAVVGRYANRIGGARFTLDGREYRIAANDGAHSLHSGPRGFDQREWTLEACDGRSARFSLVSPDGDNGFPGTLRAGVEYRLEDDGLAIVLSAATDAPTVASLTHHAYFNLAGEDSARPVTDHWLQLPASRYTPVEGLIPNGELARVAGTPFDFRTPKPIGADIAADDAQLREGSGYDHNFVLDGTADGVRRVAALWEPESGRVLEVHSDQPGVQFYTGNHLAGGAPGTSGRAYAAREGLCLEPQRFPDSPNRPDFPSARLNPGERYLHRMAFRFRTAASPEEAFGAE